MITLDNIKEGMRKSDQISISDTWSTLDVVSEISSIGPYESYPEKFRVSYSFNFNCYVECLSEEIEQAKNEIALDFYNSMYLDILKDLHDIRAFIRYRSRDEIEEKLDLLISNLTK